MFGAIGVYNCYPGQKKSTRISQLSTLLSYSLNKQVVLYLGYQLFLNENKREIFGEIGYYDFFFYYYGIGNDSRFDLQESYLVKYPSLRFNFLEQVAPNFRAGLSYKADGYDIFQTFDEGLLETEQPTGYDGGITSIAGLIFRYDTRDHVNMPWNGSLTTLTFEHSNNWLGSDFKFSRWRLESAKYLNLKKKQVLALNLITGSVSGDAPIQELMLYGGGRRGRGVIEGRYRDNAMMLMQAEYRFPLFWRLRGGVFTSYGKINTIWMSFTKVWYLTRS